MLIGAIPEQDWTEIPYWLEGSADVAETTYVPFTSRGASTRSVSSSGG